MSATPFPAGYLLERLARHHPRKTFASGQNQVDSWLKSKALQNQDKHLSATKVLIAPTGHLAGYYTLATGEVDFGDLPSAMAKKLPRRRLPAAVLAWLGVAADHQGKGLGRLLLAHALRDCHEAGQIFAFVAVILDCIDDAAKAFYQRYDFTELPGHPYRLYLSAVDLEAMMQGH